MSVMRVSGSYDHNAICDVCGFKFKASMLRKRWDGYMVCKHDYEARHPLDFYTTRNDTHLLPWTRSDSNGTDVSPSSNSINWALQANGGVASSPSSHGSFPPNHANDGDTYSAGYAFWADGDPYVYPDYLQITFSQTRPVTSAVVYSVQNNFLSPSSDLEYLTGTAYCVKDFMIQAYINSNWVTVATVYGNNRIKRSVSFGLVNTDRMRICILKNQDAAYSRIKEIEFYGTYGGTEATAVAGRAVSGKAISGRE